MIGAGLVVSGLFGPLTVRGPGSAVSARVTADLLLSGTIDAWAPRWVGVVLYLPPILAASTVASLGLRGRWAVVVGLVLGVGIVAAVLAIGKGLGHGLPTRAGSGYARMLWGGALVVAAGIARVALERRRAPGR